MSPDERGVHPWLCLVGLLLIAAGLLLNVRLVEAFIAHGGVLHSPFLRGVVLAVQVVLILGGGFLLAWAGVRFAWLAAFLVATSAVGYATAVEPTPYQVLDCRAGEARCHAVSIREYYGAAECWQSEPTSCEPRRHGIEAIAYITDPTNYVHGPFTSEPPVVEPIEASLQYPWDLVFTPDGTIILTERGGRVVRIGPGGDETILEWEPLVTWGAGLLGIEIDPDYRDNHRLYLHYTVGYDRSDPAFLEMDPWATRVLSRVSRFVMEGDSLRKDGVLLDSIPGSPAHSGGRLALGPDRKLYLLTGDADAQPLSQDPTSLAGKILRFELDGSIPDDNPVPDSYVYSLGHRNPQGIAWHPELGDMYQAEHGSERFDEINRVEPGGNHGWPAYECDTPTGEELVGHDPVMPVKCFEDYTFAPSGMTFVDDPESPWFGDLFVAGLRGKHLRRFRIENGEVASEEIFFVSEGAGRNGFGNHQRAISHRLRHVVFHDGSLYVIGDEYGLVRLSPALEP